METPPTLGTKPPAKGVGGAFYIGLTAMLLAWWGGMPLALMAVPLGIAAILGGALGALIARFGRERRPGAGRALAGLAFGVVALVTVLTGVVREMGSPMRGPQGGPPRQDWSRMGQPPGEIHGFREPLAAFDSRLPILVFHTGGQGIGMEDCVVRAEMYEAGGAGDLRSERAQFAGLVSLNRRGYSSLRLPKPSWTLHTLDGASNQAKVALLGMPAGEDWVLYAPFEDKTLLRDVLAFELARKMGHYAPRTRFVEVFLDPTEGPVSRQDYLGVYVLMEKIKRGADRVDIAKLGPQDRAEPEVSGGYIIKRDHRDRAGRRFHTGRGGPYFHVYPREEVITPEQSEWLRRYLERFEDVLHGPDYRDPQRGYAAFLDVDVFIDAHWLIEASRNVDGFRYSAYLVKDRGGKLRTEPPWDWNRSFGNANYYDGWETDGWYWHRLRDSEICWYGRLREDPAFRERAAARWRELRRTVFDPESIAGRIDALAAELEGAQQRNFQRWPILGRQVTCNYYVGRTYEDEVRWLKRWIERRLAWIDSQVAAGSD